MFNCICCDGNSQIPVWSGLGSVQQNLCLKGAVFKFALYLFPLYLSSFVGVFILLTLFLSAAQRLAHYRTGHNFYSFVGICFRHHSGFKSVAFSFKKFPEKLGYIPFVAQTIIGGREGEILAKQWRKSWLRSKGRAKAAWSSEQTEKLNKDSSSRSRLNIKT